MDPCPFVRVLIGNLALKISTACRTTPTSAGVHPSAAPCYCKIRLNNLPYQTSSIPLDLTGADPTASPQTLTLAAVFHLSSSDLAKLTTASSSIFSSRSRVKIAIYTGSRGSTCGVASGKLLGKVTVPVDLKGGEARVLMHQNGWSPVRRKHKESNPSAASLHVTVRSEPDPRFVFEFGGDPECSPQVFQVQGGRRQPVFTCKFSCRNDRHNRSRSMPSESTSTSRSWLSSLGSDRERRPIKKERKGWSVTIHDLSGSPVALASMVTPFVASPGSSDRVSRSNPGAWLILCPGDGTWKPWARLEAWRERGAGSGDGLGYRFDLLPDAATATTTTMGPTSGITLAESTLSTAKGGKFTIDVTGNNNGAHSPGCSPRGGSGDLLDYYKGFVMSSTVQGEGKCSSRPMRVEVGVQQVGCTEDAAVFVALAAAIDLSVDACRLFSHKLRKELMQQMDGLFT